MTKISSGGSRIFPEMGGGGVGGTNPRGGANLLLGENFPENCMKMKEVGGGGRGTRPWHSPLDPLYTKQDNICDDFASGRRELLVH